MVLAWLVRVGRGPGDGGLGAPGPDRPRVRRGHPASGRTSAGRRRGGRPVRRLWARVDERLVAPGPGFRVAEVQILLAAVIALRLATRDWTLVAERPAALRDGLTVMSWYTGTPAPWALVAVQVVGLACALLVLAQRRPHLAFVGLWIAYTALTALWGSSGKVMHNDVLTVLVAAVFLFASGPPRTGWAERPGPVRVAAPGGARGAGDGVLRVGCAEAGAQRAGVGVQRHHDVDPAPGPVGAPGGRGRAGGAGPRPRRGGARLAERVAGGGRAAPGADRAAVARGPAHPDPVRRVRDADARQHLAVHRPGLLGVAADGRGRRRADGARPGPPAVEQDASSSVRLVRPGDDLEGAGRRLLDVLGHPADGRLAPRLRDGRDREHDQVDLAGGSGPARGRRRWARNPTGGPGTRCATRSPSETPNACTSDSGSVRSRSSDCSQIAWTRSKRSPRLFVSTVPAHRPEMISRCCAAHTCSAAFSGSTWTERLSSAGACGCGTTCPSDGLAARLNIPMPPYRRRAPGA